jgi:hypothetical protein
MFVPFSNMIADPIASHAVVICGILIIGGTRP